MKETRRTIEADTFPCRLDIQLAEGVTGVPAEEDLARWASSALQVGRVAAEMCIRVVDESEIRELNHRYRNRDEATNVLSFPCEYADETGMRLVGDVVICAERVVEEAQTQGKPLDAHWAHLVIHGTLHLLGYDHQDDAGAEEMEGFERTLLGALGYADPYETDD